MKIAIVGSGISGLSAAWLLGKQHEVVLYEAARYLGGHTNTVDVDLDGTTHPVDTGFLVHNDLTYPNLIQLFQLLGVETYPTEMSFSVQLPRVGIEWAGTSLNTVFGQRQNLIRPDFLEMLREIIRFNSLSRNHLAYAESAAVSLGKLLADEGYSERFRDWYLVPMAAAIWSSSPKDILEFPASTFLHFCLNHRLLQVFGRPEWRSIVGGGRSYVEKMAKEINVRIETPVKRVVRREDVVLVSTAEGIDTFDAIIFATHAPDTLSMLHDRTESEAAVLGAIGYQPNLAILHTDKQFLPQRERLWAAWNYLAGLDHENSVCVTYLLNKLQKLPFESPLMVTLNPPPGGMPEHEIARFHYSHPVFDQSAIEAQKRLPSIQGQNRTWFCGAWCGYGFHEDGLKSTLRIIGDFNVEAPWTVSL